MGAAEYGLHDYDEYIARLFAPEDKTLRQTQAVMQQEGLRPINISATGGQMLHLLASLIGARRILEIGTLGGYSAIWLGRALPADGTLVSLEIDEHHAAVARRNLAGAGLAAQVEVRVGPALATLTAMEAAGEAPFDLVFIDADKEGYPAYLEKAVALVREGGLILADNTLREEVLDDADSGPKAYNAAVAAHPALLSTIVPVLRREGLDGVTISIKRGR